MIIIQYTCNCFKLDIDGKPIKTVPKWIYKCAIKVEVEQLALFTELLKKKHVCDVIDLAWTENPNTNYDYEFKGKLL